MGGKQSKNFNVRKHQVEQEHEYVTQDHANPILDRFEKSSKLYIRKTSSVKTKKSLTIQDITSDLYLDKNHDKERKKEKDRQQRLHYFLKKTWNFLYRAELNNPKIIVHWRCGIGIWDMEMAAVFPNAKVIGIDFKEAILPNLKHHIPNLEFKTTAFEDDLTGLESFEDNSVDFIMLRDVWLTNAPVLKWYIVLNQCFRILKPGGAIELTEHHLSHLEGVYTNILRGLCEKLYNEIGITFRIGSKLGDFLKQTGFDSINAQSIGIPLGEWPSSPGLKETGYLFKDLFERRLRSLSKWIAKVNQMDVKEVNGIIEHVLLEETDKNHAYVNWFSYTAMKPL